jgi:hypothetical protein
MPTILLVPTDEKAVLERRIVRLAVAVERVRATSQESYNKASAELDVLDKAVRDYSALLVTEALPD